ncbi:MAG: DNA (cytosine-5-)-methyltransferase [Sphingomonadaceae bacterium]|nr:DNA (cytosine-5-)-methyltransferase [Sphingomonadaceae bacterium]
MVTAVSLFTGCGGSDAGLLSAGFEILMANDVAAYARDFYEANFPATDYRLGDVADIKNFPKADLLVGCYPCQGFSVGGVRDPTRRINYLYREFDRALRQIQPKAFIVENVAGMVRGSHNHLLRNQLIRFRLAGYRVSHRVLDAQEFGVPQERSRLFFVGLRSDLGVSFKFPSPTHALSDGDGLPICPTIQDAIGDLPLWPEGEYDTQPFHWYYLSRNRWRGWHERARTVVAVSRHMSLHPISPPLKRIHTDAWEFERDGPARRFSYREASRLQGFARNLSFPETAGIRMRYQAIGNAVPPPLFAAVAGALPNVW